MRLSTLAFGLVVASCSLQAPAAVLDKIDRTIEKQPNYQSTPLYCLLVFGREAKTHIWIVVDGDRLYVDRNKDRDLTQPKERIQIDRSGYFRVSTLREVVETPSQRFKSDSLNKILDNQNAVTHTAFSLKESSGGWRMSIRSRGAETQRAGWSPGELLRFSSSPKNAPIIHFNGPKTIGQYGLQQTLPRSGAAKTNYRKTWLKLMVGTPGVGRGTFAAFHCKCRRDKKLKGDVAFAGKDQGPPVNITQALEMRG